MTLPDATRLSRLGEAGWAALGARLRAVGVTAERAREIARIGEGMPDAQRPPLRRWHLRRADDDTTIVLRLLVFGDAVAAPDADHALGAPLVRGLRSAGLVAPLADGRLVSPFYLSVVDDLYVFCDDLTEGGDAVMGAGETTMDLCQAAYPRQRLGDLLDLGCGAGTVALLFSRFADRAVGVDLNGRALSLSRVNAAVNGMPAVDFRQGDLFEPVVDERFDLVVSQPPYVALPAGAAPATFLHGGPRGDELPLRVLAGVTRHLSPSGRACLLVEWPIVDDEPLERRTRNALASDEPSVLIVRYPATDLDNYCTRYAASHHPTLGEPFERAAWSMREQLEREAVRELRLALTVVQRGPRPPWTSTIDIPGGGGHAVTSERIDALVATRDLLAAPRDALLAATLRAPGATVRLERPLRGGEPTARLHFPAGSLVYETELNEHALRLVELVDRAPDVGDAVRRFAAEHDGEPEDRILDGVRQALLQGMLEVQSV
jgi:methylase of polypeptide subunit release factors